MSVQVPEYLGGLGGEAVFIDTEGSFLVERLVDMAEATALHCQQVAAALQAQGQMPDDVETPVENLTRDNLLKGVHYFRCQDYVQLLALMHILPDFLKEHSQVRVVVTDSIAFHFRHDFHDLALRTRLLNGLAQDSGRIAARHHVAVVLTNQMTTRFGGSDDGKGYQLVPALGESWGHAATLRLVLHWKNHTRQATLYKSPSSPETTVPYQITMGGVRDLSDDSDNVLQNQPQTACEEVEQPLKRARLDSS
jgi:RAD51-like protein 2